MFQTTEKTAINAVQNLFAMAAQIVAGAVKNFNQEKTDINDKRDRIKQNTHSV